MSDPRTNSHLDHSGFHVGYILKQYPRLSETFILNEILGLEAADTRVSVFSLRAPTEGRFHPALASVKADVHYVPAVEKSSFLEALRALPGFDLARLDDVLAFVDLPHVHTSGCARSYASLPYATPERLIIRYAIPPAPDCRHHLCHF